MHWIRYWHRRNSATKSGGDRFSHTFTQDNIHGGHGEWVCKSYVALAEVFSPSDGSNPKN